MSDHNARVPATVPLHNLPATEPPPKQFVSRAEADALTLDVFAQLLHDRLELARTPGATVTVDRVPAALLVELHVITDAARDCIGRILHQIDPRLVRDANTMANLMRSHVTDAYQSPPGE